jgi:uncharacterized protein (TIGR04222 family)
VNSAGLLTQADDAAAGSPDWLDAAPFAAGGSTARVRSKLKTGWAVAGIRRRLQADGLAPSQAQVAVMWAGAGALYVALLVVGMLRVHEGISNHRPVSDLVLLILLALIVVPFLLRRKVASAARATRSGRRYVRELRRGQMTGPAGQVAPVDLAMAGAQETAPGGLAGWGAAAAGAAVGAGLMSVALAGFAGVPDQMTRTALLAGLPSSSGGSGSGSSGCSGGSSCGGGGGCGGGGCGG